jgi:hypothetical protein
MTDQPYNASSKDDADISSDKEELANKPCRERREEELEELDKSEQGMENKDNSNPSAPTGNSTMVANYTAVPTAAAAASTTSMDDISSAGRPNT